MAWILGGRVKTSMADGYVSLELLEINFATDRDETLSTLRDGFR
ncbi:MAG: hypothetical protein WAK12_09665 [Acidimicrobiales bacterium]